MRKQITKFIEAAKVEIKAAPTQLWLCLALIAVILLPVISCLHATSTPEHALMRKQERQASTCRWHHRDVRSFLFECAEKRPLKECKVDIKELKPLPSECNKRK